MSTGTISTPHIPGRADITVVMITVDRSPKRNYLQETIANLTRGGVFTSERLHSFTLLVGEPIEAVSGEYRETISDLLNVGTYSLTARERLLPCENAGRALILGSKLASRNPGGWVLFLEDDIDCCSDFLGSVGRWLDRYGDDPSCALCQFGCPYTEIQHGSPLGGVWQYPSTFNFYGTQAIAVRPIYAQALGTIISTNPAARYCHHHSEARWLTPSEYDLMIGHWAATNGHNISASAPSLIQHIGQDSSLSSRSTCHTFPSWPGRGWSYK